MTTLTSADAQQLEFATALRIKFAAINGRGDLVGDAHDEYEKFFEKQFAKDSSASYLGFIETRTEASRKAWHVRNGQVDLVAVEHETGIELLLIGVATNVVSTAVIAFAVWGWRRWKGLRENSPYPKVDASFVIEVPRRAPTGGPALPPLRLVIPPPVSDADIARYLSRAMDIGIGE